MLYAPCRESEQSIHRQIKHDSSPKYMCVLKSKRLAGSVVWLRVRWDFAVGRRRAPGQVFLPGTDRKGESQRSPSRCKSGVRMQEKPKEETKKHHPSYAVCERESVRCLSEMKIKPKTEKQNFFLFSNAANEEIITEAFWMRPRCVSATEVKRHGDSAGSNRPRPRHRRDELAVSFIIAIPPALRQGSPVFHPSQPVGVFFDGEDFARVLFDPAVPFPDAAGFARVLERGTEIRSALLAEGFLHHVQLLAVAAGDVDFDLDGTVDVAHGSADAPGEARAALERCEAFECHGDSGGDTISSGFGIPVYAESSPLAFPVVGSHFENLQECWSNVVLCV